MASPTQSGSVSEVRLQHQTYRVLPTAKQLVKEAKRIEELLKRLMLDLDTDTPPKVVLGRYPTLKQLNNFGTQIIIRMCRSSDRFHGFKMDFDQHILKPHILFLVGTLCDDFNHLHTSPLNGIRALDIGCGALSSYGPDLDTSDLLAQFYQDHPPVTPEILQMLGAHTIGLDPRQHDSDEYSYQSIYKHKVSEFTDVQPWLSRLSVTQKFDLISCFNLFDRPSFAFHHHTPETITEFFKGIRRGLTSEGVVYTSAPLLPSSSEHRRTNRKIFAKAGFKIIHEGYYFILEPMRSRSSKSSKSSKSSQASKSPNSDSKRSRPSSTAPTEESTQET